MIQLNLIKQFENRLVVDERNSAKRLLCQVPEYSATLTS